MVARADPATPVVFLDTLKLFPETLAYRDALAERLGLTAVRTIRPAPQDNERHDPDGSLSFLDAVMFCPVRKTDPLVLALARFEPLFIGRKRITAGRSPR